MLTTEDLNKIRGVIREEVGTSEGKLCGEITNLETKMEHRFNAVDKRFDIVDKKFDAVDKRFEGIEKHLRDMEKQMEQDRKDWSVFFNQAGIFFDEMRNQLTKRIKKLEENQDLKN